MKILHTADWHIGNFPGPEKDGQNLRAIDTMNCLKHMCKIAEEEKPDVIVVSGDIFHQARVWADRGLSEVRYAIKIIEELAQICPIIVLRGTPNHDGEEQFELLKEHFESFHGVEIVTEPKVIHVLVDIEPFLAKTVEIACLPGFDRGVYRAKFPGLSKEEENQAITEELSKSIMALKAQCKPSMPSILISHYTVPGSNTESGQVQFFSQLEPVILPETLDAANFDLVALGHIHRPQQVPSCKNTFYSGAINSFNFNDEGQERGFWIHHFEDCKRPWLTDSEFHKTPSREFKTIKLDDETVALYNVAGFEMIADENIYSAKDCIVRVLYSCTEEESKAFNRAALERELYEKVGVFWVAEITPDNITVDISRDKLSEQSNPEVNLINYLKGKAFNSEKIAEIVEIARPIISEALANGITSRLTGVFVPIEIEVKNYRNYVEERFNFKDITFCTINGKNGAGKSSLFMDAILDCLYEEPREGELTAWIRADENARSGSISFTFAIGDKTFRVVRTRTKSGKATLNLSELVDGEWENRSKEKIRDTQEDIINLLGMDSLTFRSCALIMQDQYGLFLQADKESRMTILGNILGLGIYGDMENLARARLSDLNRKILFAKNDIANLQNNLSSYGDPRYEIEIKQGSIKHHEAKKEELMKERDIVNIALNSKLEQAERARKLEDSINTLREKETAIQAKLKEQNSIVTGSEILLAQEPEIQEKIARIKALEAKEKELVTQKTLYDSKVEEIKATESEVVLAKKQLDAEIQLKINVVAQIDALKTRLEKGTELRLAAEEYASKSDQLSKMEQLSTEYIKLSNQMDLEQKKLTELKISFNNEASSRKAILADYERKTNILSESNCIDIERANCKFLADAKQAAAQIETYRAECTAWKEEEQKRIEQAAELVAELSKKRNDLGFNANEVSNLRAELARLEPLKKEYDDLSAAEVEIRQLEMRLADIDVSLSNSQQRLAQAKEKLENTQQQLVECQESALEYNAVVSELSRLQEWKEKEKMLPVYRERMANAKVRIVELTEENSAINAEITNLQNELFVLKQSLDGMEDLKSQIELLDNEILTVQKDIDVLLTEIGTLQKTLEDIKKTEAQISELSKCISADSDCAANYEILKNAFSQDGIPHNIIRSIVPMLTATSNTILGQMTGGKMGMQFVTDKVLKSNKKEVVTLDIVIEEYGKDTLPYLSKSGGEKVKASLSAILALAEIKSTQAGIQLGMLFIDEPPFLDDEGTQAYCDALETIQQRYSDLKIMAITHDPTFKARFPQNLDIVKTENGSRVIFA